MRSIPARSAPRALESLDLHMPADDLPPGPTRDLRRAMARFRDGEPHAAARSDVHAELVRIDPEQVAKIAARRTRELVARREADAVPVLVPAAAMAEAATVIDPDDTGAHLVDLLTRVGDTVVAGRVDDDRADVATAELLSMVDGCGDPVALVSILHQTRGATGALIDELRAGGDRQPAVAATKRTATNATSIDGFGVVAAGETVAVELDLQIEFGCGRHECPGRSHALAIADAVLGVLTER